LALAVVLAVPVLLGALASTHAWASGVTGGIGSQQPQHGQRPVDERYEYGKALYLGRLPSAAKISYCVVADDKARKLKRRSLKPFRKKSRLELAQALVHCDSPEQLALQGLEPGQAAFIIYYLDKRYRLKLEDS
ncbi:MAG: hypothetical protein AB8B93_04520, partial [Pseudomonadales bacterium]